MALSIMRTALPIGCVVAAMAGVVTVLDVSRCQERHGPCSALFAMPAPDASDRRPDPDEGDGYEERCRDADVDGQEAGILRALGEVTEEADDVIADRRDREALDRLLQPQLEAGALVHGRQQVAVLLLECDIDAGA